jgi:hypothetical protein
VQWTEVAQMGPSSEICEQANESSVYRKASIFLVIRFSHEVPERRHLTAHICADRCRQVCHLP